MRGKTVIAIAHRLSTIAAMDRLVVMEDGQIVEEGDARRASEARRSLCATLDAPIGRVPGARSGGIGSLILTASRYRLPRWPFANDGVLFPTSA